MGNAIQQSRMRENDKFFIGNAVAGRKSSRDPTARGRVLDIKVTVPRKTSHQRGTKHKAAVHSCRVCVSPVGAVISGRHMYPHEIPCITSADIASQYEEAVGARLSRLTVPDSRACQLLAVPQPQFQRWWIVPARQPFNRHSGTCRVLGDRNMLGSPVPIKAGDFLRLGSVGLLVTETHNGTNHVALSEVELQELAMDQEGFPEELFDGEAGTLQSEGRSRKNFIASNTIDYSHRLRPFQCNDELNTDDVLADMGLNSFNTGTLPPASPNEVDGIVIDDEVSVHPPLQCYMCFDGEESDDNPLVAPCSCKGSTKYVHVQCLQSWHSSKESHRPCIVSNKKGAQVCGVCKSPYKTHLRLPNGDFIPLLRPRLRPPFISFTVCTRHQHQEELFSTRFHLSFSTIMGNDSTSLRPLVIGRSQSSDMVLDYRTVSTHHAAINFSDGTFNILDLRSSNGSFLYVKEPLMLRWGETVRLRWGKGSISIKAQAPTQSCLPIGLCSSSNAVNAPNTEDIDMTTDLLNQLASSLPVQHVSLLNNLVLSGIPLSEPRFRAMFCYEERKSSEREEEKSRIPLPLSSSAGVVVYSNNEDEHLNMLNEDFREREYSERLNDIKVDV